MMILNVRKKQGNRLTNQKKKKWGWRGRYDGLKMRIMIEWMGAEEEESRSSKQSGPWIIHQDGQTKRRERSVYIDKDKVEIRKFQ